jgi:hypothetical protein
VAKADVLIENFRPEAKKAAGLSPEDLLAAGGSRATRRPDRRLEGARHPQLRPRRRHPLPGHDASVVQTYSNPARDQWSLGADGRRAGA